MTLLLAGSLTGRTALLIVSEHLLIIMAVVFAAIVRGDMSLVGPRPERPEFVDDLSSQIPYYGQRHAVRPGLTGWAQVRHEYSSDVDGSLQKLQYDLFYIKHLSIAFDFFIILETIKTVLVRRGS
jgi:lipopolysaccharide/colanic/teichoic acid biosynthesis glycosyltransferase